MFFLRLLLLALTNSEVASAATPVFSAAQHPEYRSGPCMNAAWQLGGGNTTQELGCSANEVTATVVGVEGPTSCKEGEIISVNVTTSIYFRATRYDFAIYTSTVPGGDPIFGEECALDVLGAEDAGPITGGEITAGDGDLCFDVFGNGATLPDFKYQKDLRIPCLGDDDMGETKTVYLQNCFAWRSNGQNEICEEKGAYPGAASKCDCASLDLGIQIIGPTPAPSVSSMPTGLPSLEPTVSTIPSAVPSLMPSISTMPSSQPSFRPSISAAPTSQPSYGPSLSTSPSSQPSGQPSLSTQPSSQPSHGPSLSTRPTSQPSYGPSLSSRPSLQPSDQPSVSSQPSSQPSMSPSISAEPTASPSSTPSASTRPSYHPTSKPSTSAKPSSGPSESPSVTTSPSVHPTSFPSPSPSSSPTLLAAISGIIFEDSNNDGMRESEAAMSGMLVQLLNSDGAVIDEVHSDATGQYIFEDVFPGVSHTIRVVAGSAFRFSDVVVDGGNQMTQYDISTGTSSDIILYEGDSRNDVHAGVYRPIEVGNRVWEDLDGDGLQDPAEPGIAGVEVSLIDESGTIVDATQTDATGLYTFSGLHPGSYSVRFALPLGYAFTQSQVNAPITLLSSFGDGPLLNDMDSDAHVVTGTTGVVEVFSGDVHPYLDAGVYRPATIEGTVWHDLNANGIWEDGEPRMEGTVVTLYDSNGEYVDMATTGADGTYSFSGLLPGSYYGQILPATDYFISPLGGDSNFDPSTGVNAPVVLQSGKDSNGGHFDAGVWTHASVGDMIWIDTNEDGIQNEVPLIGYPYPVQIHLYDGIDGQLLSTTQSDEFGRYRFDYLVPGKYEIEFIPDDETEVFSPQFRGDNDELDSAVDPDTKRAQVYLVSAEINDGIDAGIFGDAPYYPDWEHEVQVCTNDGFDPSWMTTNHGEKKEYLYRNKETCCENHFWWRMAQCMANGEFKFYRAADGEFCDTKIDFDDHELNSPAQWTDTTLFDTKDECCSSLFAYDYSGCMERSPALFKFEFCVDVGSLLPPIDCQTADIYANVIEDAINLGLGDASDANITSVGDATLTKVDGSTECGGSLAGQDFINDLTGTMPDLSEVSSTSSTPVCGVITTESYDCTQDECLAALRDTIVSSLNSYINDGDLTANLQSLATKRLPPVPELQIATGTTGTLNTFNLLLPTTMSSQLGELQYAKDGEKCITKTFFQHWEFAYDNLQDCCLAEFPWKQDECCTEGGGGCSTFILNTPNDPSDPSLVKFFPNWVPGQLCDAKPISQFESWEVPFDSLQECCDERFPWDVEGCCASAGMGGCNGDAPPVAPPPSPPGTPVAGPNDGPSDSPHIVIKYYPTWTKGQLCAAKAWDAFEEWEEPFDSKEACCREKFWWDIDGCCGAGGCPSN